MYRDLLLPIYLNQIGGGEKFQELTLQNSNWSIICWEIMWEYVQRLEDRPKLMDMLNVGQLICCSRAADYTVVQVAREPGILSCEL